MKTRRIGDIPTAEDLTGAQIASLRRDVSALQQQSEQQSAIVVGVPQPFQPFTVLFDEIKGQVWAYLPIAIPSEIDELTEVIIKASDSTSQAAYSANKLTFEITDIDENEKEAGFIQRKFGHKLEYDTDYWLTRLNGNPGRLKNPDKAPAFNDPPLATFRTPVLFGSPSRPHLGNILENSFNTETESWDAFVVVQIIAPASATANATGTVSIASGSSIVTGTGTSFTTQVQVGRGVTVNGETHIVTAVTDNTHITVDHPFRQTLAGQAMQVLTLMTWGEAKAERITPKFKQVGDPNSQPINEGHHFSTDELALTSISFRINKFLAGRQYEWVRTVLSGQGESKDITALTPQLFVAGGFSQATPGIPEISVDFIFESKDPQDGKNVAVKAKIAQPSPPVALESAELRLIVPVSGTVSITGGSNIITGSGTSFLSNVDESNLIIIGAQTFTVLAVNSNTQIIAEEQSTVTAGGQAWTLARVKDTKRIRKAKFHPAGGGVTKPLNFGNQKTKKLLNQTFVLVITAVNGQQKVVQENFLTGSGDVSEDTAPPTLATPSFPTVEDWFGTIHVTCPTPVANVNTLVEFEVVMSTLNFPPVGPPTVGSEGVVKIKRDQHVTFRPKQRQDETLFFYYRCRNATFSLFSNWSTGTSLSPDGVARPLDDVIGTGVPLLPQALERSATSGVGHTLTTFVLDTGASSEDDAYNGRILFIPSESADDQIRVVLDYAGATRLCTVAAFASAPVGAVLYELHRGQTRAANSGAGHTLTAFVLDAGASSSDDAYNGQVLYIPSLASGDRIRRVLDYVGATRTATIESAFGATPVGVKGFILFPGTVGFANSNQSGIASGAPLRVYLDSDTNQDVVELILPSGENAFSLTQGQLQVVRLNNGAIKFDQKITLSATTVFTFNAPSAYTPVIRVRFRNLYRESGSDGWSAWSSWVLGFRSTDTPNIVYAPGDIPPIEVDFQDSGNYPGSRYGAY